MGTCIPCLGIDVNVVTGIMSIPEQKLAGIVEMCAQWAGNVKTHKKALQSLAGSIIHKCIHPARLFVNRVLATLREAPESGPSCSLLISTKTWPGLTDFYLCLREGIFRQTSL